jgi:hypothetical protein
MPRVSAVSISPRPSDRAIFVGQTGSGKTTLAEQMASTRRYVVALDPKGLLKWKGYQRYTTLDGMLKAVNKAPEKLPRVIYAPTYDELLDPDTVDDFFKWVYLRKNCLVYVDELYAITKNDTYPFHLGACYTRGRERQIETWGATQRPARVPQIVFSEAEHVYCFRLRMPQDRDRVEDMTGIPAESIALLPKRRFIYAPQEGDISAPMELDLTGRV